MTVVEEVLDFVEPPHPPATTLVERTRRLFLYSWFGLMYIPKLGYYCLYDFDIIYDLVRFAI